MYRFSYAAPPKESKSESKNPKTVTAANFASTQLEQMEVALGRATVTELALKPAQLTEQVVVTRNDALAIDPTSKRIQISLTDSRADERFVSD